MLYVATVSYKKLGEKYPPWITYTSGEILKCIYLSIYIFRK